MSGNSNSGRKPAGYAGTVKPTFACAMPTDFNEDAMVYWNQIVPLLVKRNQLSDTDYPALCRLCRLQADLRQCERDLDRDGLTVRTTGSRGQDCFIRHPAADLKLKIAQLLAALERKFGLTPADRPEIKVEKDNPPSIRDKY